MAKPDLLKDWQEAQKRIAELESEVNRWKDASTTAQGHIDAAEKGLIPLCAPGWKHDWIGDLVEGAKERIAELAAERTALLAELAGMREALNNAGDAVHSEYCGPAHHAECTRITAALTTPATDAALERIKMDEFKRGWRQAFAEVAVSIPCDYKTLYGGELWVEKFEQALEQARMEAKAEALTQLADEIDAEIAKERETDSDVIAGITPVQALRDRAAALRGGQ